MRPNDLRRRKREFDIPSDRNYSVIARSTSKGRLFRPRACDPNWNSQRLRWCRQETRLVHAKVLPTEGETFSAPETSDNCEALIHHFSAETAGKGTVERTD